VALGWTCAVSGRIALLAVVAVVAAGCHATGPVAPSPRPAASATAPASQPATPAPAAPLGSLTCAPAAGTMAAPGVLVLRSVSATAHPRYDAIVFAFTELAEPATPAGVATYTVAPATPPFVADPSGQALSVTGSAFLRVSFHDAYGYDPVHASPEARYTGPADVKPGLGTLLEAREAGDFEGYLTWILGLSHGACWQVIQGTGPPVFEVDVPA
jgi:hypothetical protein